MKKLYSKNTAVIIIIIILFSCKKTENVGPPPAPPPPATITASVAGLITDQKNAPVSGASVSAGGSTTTIDANGQFTLKDIQLDKYAGIVNVTKSGYFAGARTFLVNGNATNYIRIQMIPKTVSGTIASSAGGNIDVTGGAKINFTGGSFANAGSNTTYAGQVSVAGYYLNPVDTSLNESKPGDLRGISAANKEGIIKSFGMLAVEMNDAAGQKLQLASGKTATITIPIPSAMQTGAPATISLWYFDEAKGIWKEEGTATKQGGNYTGTVSHFSFWTAGQLSQGIKLSATFKDSLGNVQSNKSIWISWGQFDDEWTTGYTDNTGKISIQVPANTTLKIGAINDCGNTMFKKFFGPFSSDVDLGILTVNDNGVTVNITLSGTAVNCNNSPVTRGLATVAIPNFGDIKSPITNGAFSLRFNYCKNSLAPAGMLSVYDSVSGQISNQYPITIGSANQNIGQVQVCNSSPPVAGFTYSIGNTSLPVTVTFTNTSTNSTSWLWDFGDGVSSTAQNPTHTYATAGSFPVSLTATGPAGSNTYSRSISISGTVADADSLYIYLRLDSTNYSWVTPDPIVAWYSNTATFIRGGDTTQLSKLISFNILNNNASPGTYNITLSAGLNGISYPNNSASTTVTEYGVPGGLIIGTASGQMKSSDSTRYIPFSMSYRVKRLY